MIKTELLDNGRLIHHYTDDRRMGLLQEDTGIVYDDAIDLNPTTHTYKEVPVERPEPTTEEQLAEANEALRILGVNV